MNEEIMIAYRWFLNNWKIRYSCGTYVWYKGGQHSYYIRDFLKPYIMFGGII